MSVGIVATGKSGAFVTVSGSANKALNQIVKAVVSGKVNAGASASVGIVLPYPGKTSGDVVGGNSNGGSVNIGGFFTIQLEGGGNKNGASGGMGGAIGGPGVNFGPSYGVPLGGGSQKQSPRKTN